MTFHNLLRAIRTLSVLSVATLFLHLNVSAAEAGVFNPQTDISDSRISYTLENKALTTNYAIYGTYQILRENRYILLFSYYSFDFYVFDTGSFSNKAAKWTVTFDGITDKPTYLGSIGRDSMGNVFAVSLDGDGEYFIYPLTIDTTNQKIYATASYRLGKQSGWYQYIPIVYGDVTSGNFTVFSTVRLKDDTSSTYPRLCKRLVRWNVADGAEQNREVADFPTTMSELFAIDGEHLIVDDIAPSNQSKITTGDNYPSTPTLIHWPAGGNEITRLSRITISDTDAESPVNDYGMTYKIFSYGGRDFIVYCVNGLTATYNIATLQNYPESLEIGQILWTLSSDMTFDPYDASPSDEQTFPDVEVSATDIPGVYEITICTKDKIAVYSFSIEGASDGPDEAQALDVSLSQRTDGYARMLFDISLGCRLSDTAAQRLSDAGLDIDRLTLIVDDKAVATKLNESTAADAIKFTEGDYTLVDGKNRSTIHAFGAEIILDKEMRQALTSAEGISFTWSDIDPTQNYTIAPYISNGAPGTLETLNLRQGTDEPVLALQLPDAAEISISNPAVTPISLGDQTLSRYSDLNAINAYIYVAGRHSDKLETNWDVKHFLTIGTHEETELAAGEGTLAGLAASDENSQMAVRTVFTRKSDGLSVQCSEEQISTLSYSETLTAPRISAGNSFIIYGNKSNAPQDATVYDAVIDYRIDFFDMTGKTPAAYVDYSLDVAGRDNSHSTHIDDKDAGAFSGRILTSDEIIYDDNGASVQGLEGYDASTSPARLIALNGHAPVHIHHICCLSGNATPETPISLDTDFKITYPILSLRKPTYTSATGTYRAIHKVQATDDSAEISEYVIDSSSPAGESLKISTEIGEELFNHVTTRLKNATVTPDCQATAIYTIDGRRVTDGSALAPGIYIRIDSNGSRKIIVPASH